MPSASLAVFVGVNVRVSARCFYTHLLGAFRWCSGTNYSFPGRWMGDRPPSYNLLNPLFLAIVISLILEGRVVLLHLDTVQHILHGYQPLREQSTPVLGQTDGARRARCSQTTQSQDG